MNPPPDQDLRAERDFWTELLASSGAALELPLDHPRPPAPSYFRDHAVRVIPAQRWAALAADAVEPPIDRFTCLLAAYALVASRYSGANDVLCGSAAAETPNIIPLRIRIPDEGLAGGYLARVQSAVAAAARNAALPFAAITDLAPHKPLFRAVLLPAPGTSLLWPASQPPAPAALRAVTSGCDLVLTLAETDGHARLELDYDAELFEPATMERLLGHIEEAAWQLATNSHAAVQDVPITTAAERGYLIHEVNATAVAYDRGVCVHELIEQQASRTPAETAVVFGDDSLTYTELNARANRLAHLLVASGVGPGAVVGVCVQRSPAMVVAALAVLKAGAAYVPMDPAYPPKRLSYMVEDAHIKLILGDGPAAERAAQDADVIRIDNYPEAALPEHNLGRRASASDLAYVIYTSGSTGNPKGVMVEHRNVANFFAGMDARLGTAPGVWLAVTSLSFDISVLELFWTLARGFTIVLYSSQAPATVARQQPGTIEFGLFYFGSDEGDYAALRGRQKYRLLLEGARFADTHGFSAVWTPERHFHTFGGLFPSPAVMAGALATVTERVALRAGSVVLPLNNPVRVAEEWALVDNLSEGRAEISFASGWQPQDFALAPQAYASRSEQMFEDIATVRALWRGETRDLPGGDGKPVTITTRPRPVQPELPVWVTAGGSPETFRRAGAIGAKLLTHLLGQSIEQLTENIAVYRQSWREHGHPGAGHVALMLHTFVSHDAATVRAQAHDPLKRYLRGSVGLFTPAAAARGLDVNDLSPEDLDELAEHAFERYFESGGLFGTPESCAPLVEKLHATGVDELACLIDFGIPDDVVVASLPFLDELRKRFEARSLAARESIDSLIGRHGVTHLQCTPSMASMLLADAQTAASLAGLAHMLVGGEALTPQLATALRVAIPAGRITNMYGPTETTVWSTTHEVTSASEPIPIGTPIANTQVYILDPALNPLPVNVIGDLWIAGDGVARGYLGRPELTAERFLNDPFVAASDQRGPAPRMYRTGDLARRRPDGTLEFLGRADHQVKLRGYRIELGEIESVLRQHPAVADAIVSVREVTPGDQRLVAYLVARPHQLLSMDDIRAYARDRLLEYMVPSAFVVLDALPLTPNGKTDRNALPNPSHPKLPERTAPPAPLVLPRAETERAIARIWCDVLNVPAVGIGENFFDLGGHSMLLVHVLNQIRTMTRKQIAMSDMFLYPTVEALAGFLADTHLTPLSAGTGQDRAAQRRESRNGRGVEVATVSAPR